MLAYFDRQASNGPTEAINGRLEALRRNALGTPQSDPLPSAWTDALRQLGPIDPCALLTEVPLKRLFRKWSAAV
ncbi:transposase, partial [Mycobacterium marinum]|uniref:transposase n=1 Tax=Mycobacterium marinum TaxID=1781 RepID=UPI003561E77A